MKVLIVGLGSIAKKHVIAINHVFDNCIVYALRSTKIANSFEGVINIYSRDEIPKDIAFSIISNPTSQHGNVIMELVELGRPLLIEKPVLDSLNQVSELQEALNKHGVITYIGCNLRFHPVIKRLKQEMLKRRPIEMNVYCGSYLPEWRPQLDYRKVYSAQKKLGGGVHLDLIHELDYTTYLLGIPTNSQAYRSKKSNLEIDSEDIAHYVLDYSETTVFITLNYYRKVPKRQIECVWNDEIWSVDLITGTITTETGEVIFLANHDIIDTYKEQLKYFWESVENNITPMNDFNSAVEVLKICLN